MKKRSNRVLLGVLVVMTLVFAILIVNVFYVSALQIHFRSGTDISAYSDGANIKTTPLYAYRGTIYDSKNNVIAQDVTTYKIYAVLSETRVGANNQIAYVADPEYTASQLAPILDMSEEELLGYLTKEGVYQVEFGPKGKNLSVDTKKIIDSLNLPGIEFVQTTSRYYPQGSFSSHIIGFATYDDTIEKLVGRMGLEQIYNEELTGNDGYTKYHAEKNGAKLPGTAVETVPAENGSDIYLTINKNVQAALEQAFSQSMQKFSTEKVWGAVVEVETGKILAIGSSPSFDPTTLEIDDYTNMATQYAYEPGSTMKTFTYAAAIDAGVYDNNATFDSSAFKMGIQNGQAVRVYGDNYIEKIENALNASWGTITYGEGFSRSSNVGIAMLLTTRLSTKTFEEYLDKFGFFQPVNIDGLPEVSGTKTYNYPIEKLANGYGQGSSVTMAQMLQAYTAILNDGTMVQPYLIQQIKNPMTGEISYSAETTVVGNPISAETAKQVQQLMYDVVHDEDGSGRYYALDEVDVIAKTGTAQIYKNGTYNNSYVIASAAIGFPADDPKILIYYAFECQYEAKQIHYQTEPITSLIYRVAEEYNLLHSVEEEHIASQPEEYRDVSIATMPAVTNHTLEYAQSKLTDVQANIVVIGTGNQVVKQYPAENSQVLSTQTIFLLTNQGEITMPNMIGWSRKEVTAFWSMTNTDIIMSGTGMVVNQSVPEGTIIYGDTVIEIRLE